MRNKGSSTSVTFITITISEYTIENTVPYTKRSSPQKSGGDPCGQPGDVSKPHCKNHWADHHDGGCVSNRVFPPRSIFPHICLLHSPKNVISARGNGYARWCHILSRRRILSSYCQLPQCSWGVNNIIQIFNPLTVLPKLPLIED